MRVVSFDYAADNDNCFYNDQDEDDNDNIQVLSGLKLWQQLTDDNNCEYNGDF